MLCQHQKRTILIVTGIIAGMTLATSCSANSSSDTGAQVSSGADVAKLIGCSSYNNDQDQLYVADGGTCRLAGHDVFVYYFANNGDRDKWVSTAQQMAGGNYLVGDRWTAQAPTSVLTKAKANAGAGDIK